MTITVSDALGVHDGLRARIRQLGLEGALAERGWRVDPAWGVRRYGLHRSTWAALLHEARCDLRTWLASRGWRVLPDGSALRWPTTRGLIEAARVERVIVLGQAPEVLA
jgi:hypothetical protein